MSCERAKVEFFVRLVPRPALAGNSLMGGGARKQHHIFTAQKMTFVLVYLVLLHLLGARVRAETHTPRFSFWLMTMPRFSFGLGSRSG